MEEGEEGGDDGGEVRRTGTAAALSWADQSNGRIEQRQSWVARQVRSDAPATVFDAHTALHPLLRRSPCWP